MGGMPAAGPAERRTRRRVTGDLAEAAVAQILATSGWTILARNVRVGRAELDILARDPQAVLVVVEVRSRSRPGFGAPEETVDRHKVERIYRAAWQLVRTGRLSDARPPPGGRGAGDAPFRVDLITVARDEVTGGWRLSGHLRGLIPP